MLNFLSNVLPRMCISSQASGLPEKQQESKQSQGQGEQDRPLRRPNRRHAKQRKAEIADQEREEFRKRILDRAARKKSPPLMILERISEMDDGEMEPEDSDSGGGETDGEASMGYSTVSMQDWRDSKLAENPLRRSIGFHHPPQRESASQPADKPPKHRNTPTEAQLQPSLAEASGIQLKRETPPPSPNRPPPAKQLENGDPRVGAPAFKWDSRLFASLRESESSSLKIKTAFANEAVRNRRAATPPEQSPQSRTPPRRQVRAMAGENPRQRVNPTSEVARDEGDPLEGLGRRSIDGWARGRRGASLVRYNSGASSACGSGQSEPAAGYSHRYHRFSRMPAKYSPEWLAALPPQFTTPQRHASITASEPPVSRESLPLKSARPPVSSPATTDPEVKKTPQGPPTSPTRRQKGVALASQIAASVGKMTVQPKLHPPTQSAATSGRAVKLSSPEAHTQIALRYYSREGRGGGSNLRRMPEGYFIPQSSPYASEIGKQK